MSNAAAAPVIEEVADTLPDLQGWVDAHILPRTSPTHPQPTQLGRGASAGFTALVNAPETHLGFSVLAMTLPISVCAPNTGDLHKSSTLLLPYTDGQVESLLQTPMAQAGRKARGFRQTTGTERDHEHVSSIKAELLSEKCPLAEGTVLSILAGHGGIAPLAWCFENKITDPLANAEIRMYYWHHFGVAITKPKGSVHSGAIYYKSYNFWSFSQACEYMDGVEISPDNTDNIELTEQTHDDASTRDVEEPAAKRKRDADASPARADDQVPVDPVLIEVDRDEDEWSDWLSPEQADELRNTIVSNEEEIQASSIQLGHRATSLRISQDLITELKAENAKLSLLIKEKDLVCATLQNKLLEKERNEKHALAKIAQATAQAQAAALEKYAPLVALSRTLAITAGHTVLDHKSAGGPRSAAAPSASAVPVPESANWRNMPQAPVTVDNLADWRRWMAENATHSIDMKTLVSLFNSPGFLTAHRQIAMTEDPLKCYSCGGKLSPHKVAMSKKKAGRAKQSHLTAEGGVTGIASGECTEGLSGTCGGCMSHGMENTKHSLEMCPLKPFTALKVLNSDALLGAMEHAARTTAGHAKKASESGHTDSSARPRQQGPPASSASAKRDRGGSRATDNTSSASGAPPTSRGKGAKGKAGRGRAGKGKGESKGAPSASGARSSN